jgi:hypothetical protein
MGSQAGQGKGEGEADRLALVRELTLRIRSNDVELEGPKGSCRLTLHGLFELLAAFEAPAPLDQVLATLPARGPSDWAERLAMVMELRRAGILVQPGAADPPRSGFAAPAVHARMLHDTARVNGYLRAIAEVVRPGDVVVDLGTGTGVLAVAAVRAGAKHVYAIEESSIVDVARDVFAVNGVADRITLIRGHSTRVTLPERANVLVTETLGNDPLDEGILVYVDDAKRRLLTPDARLIPFAIDIVVQAVDVPLERTSLLTRDDTERWRELYGVDLSPLFAQHPNAIERFSDEAGVAKTYARVSELRTIERLELAGQVAPKAEHRVLLHATREVPRAAVALGYDAHLSPNERLQVGPHAVVPCPHWYYPIYARLDPQTIPIAGEIDVRFSRDLTSCRLDVR